MEQLRLLRPGRNIIMYSVYCVCCRCLLMTLLLFGASSLSAQPESELSLDSVIKQALSSDDWLKASELRERALRKESVSAGELPDPQLRVGLANLPVDSLDLNQEGMTQFQVGISQRFPPGKTLALRRKQKERQSQLAPAERALRQARLVRDIRSAWLRAWQARQATRLLRDNRVPFEQLVTITQSRYANTSGNTRQRDVIRARLTLTRLEDRLQRLSSEAEDAWQSLARWVPASWLTRDMDPGLPALSLSLPVIESLAQADEIFASHPALERIRQETAVAETRTALARQSSSPGYSVGASYGYRQDGPGGIRRSDFFSLEFRMELPLFTEKRQEPRVAAASAREGALRSDFQLKVRELFGDYRQLRSRLAVVQERIALYEEDLLPELETLASANLAGYRADDNDFEEVMQAYIDELDHRIKLVELKAEEQRLYSELRYLLAESRSGE